MILSWKRGEASAASALGAPPALLTRTSSRPCVGHDAVDHRLRRLGVTYVAVTWVVPGTGSASERAQVTTVAPATTKASAIPRPIPREPPVTRTTRPVRSTREPC